MVAAVEAEGERLRAEFYAPQGPRGRRGSCPLDREIEERLQARLQALIPAQFCGEECAVTPGTRPGWVWLVDPHDGTFEYTAGRRGSAISVALLREGKPVLGVVHAPDAPDRGPDTIAWAEGAGEIRRNGTAVHTDLRNEIMKPGAMMTAEKAVAIVAAHIAWQRRRAARRTSASVASTSITFRRTSARLPSAAYTAAITASAQSS